MATTLALDVRGTDKRYLFSPAIDFLLLGGASLIILPLVAVLLPAEDFKPIVVAITLAFANIINHPHFANSYQIFYRDFGKKISKRGYPADLSRRYIFAGILVPLAFIGFFSTGMISGDSLLLGRAANLMAFLVGWHYVKQGYGMLMVDSVLKKSFFSSIEKKILLTNAYACWLATWAYGNRAVEEHNYFSLKYYTFDIPDLVFYGFALAAAISTSLVFLKFVSRLSANDETETEGLPFNGVMAYLTSIYVWVMFVRVNFLFVLIVPAFHSLQYLVVVWRYQMNLESARQDGEISAATRPFGRFFNTMASYRMAAFAIIGLTLGYFGFWWAPELLDSVVAYDKGIFGASLFLFMFWIFINVHHYFIDNVIWKATNPEVRQHLFSSR